MPNDGDFLASMFGPSGSLEKTASEPDVPELTEAETKVLDAAYARLEKQASDDGVDLNTLTPDELDSLLGTAVEEETIDRFQKVAALREGTGLARSEGAKGIAGSHMTEMLEKLAGARSRSQKRRNSRAQRTQPPKVAPAGEAVGATPGAPAPVQTPPPGADATPKPGAAADATKVENAAAKTEGAAAGAARVEGTVAKDAEGFLSKHLKGAKDVAKKGVALAGKHWKPLAIGGGVAATGLIAAKMFGGHRQQKAASFEMPTADEYTKVMEKLAAGRTTRSC